MMSSKRTRNRSGATAIRSLLFIASAGILPLPTDIVCAEDSGLPASPPSAEVSEAAIADLPDLAEFKIPMWYKDATVTTGFGYKDNPTLSSTHPRGSGFWSVGGDIIVYRLPWHGWSLNAFGSFDHISYLDTSIGVDSEQVGMGMMQLSKDLGRGWKAGLGVTYMYQHQVLDLSTTQTNQYINGEVTGHNLSERLFLRKEFKPWWIEGEVSCSRQWLAEPLDSYWQMGPRLSAGRSYEGGSELTFSYQWAHIVFDEREQVDREGYLKLGEPLLFDGHALEASWHYVWDTSKRWHTITKGGLDYSVDNGSGYFDFWRVHLTEQIKYKSDGWELGPFARISYYDFPVQTVSYTDFALRHKTLLSVGFRVEKKLNKLLKAFIGHTYERSISNVSYDRYKANTTTAGVEIQF